MSARNAPVLNMLVGSLVALCMLCCTAALAGERETVAITQLSLAQDPSAELGPGDVAAGRLDFSRISPGRRSLGTSDSAFWVRIEVRNAGSAPTSQWLEVGQARLHEITLYENHNGQWLERRGGTSQPFSQREVPTLTQNFSVDLAPDTTKELLVRVASNTVIIIHPRLWSTAELLREENRNTQLEFFTAGAVVLMLFFGVAMWVMLREPGFLLFGLVSLCFLLFRWSIKGIAFREFWPDSPEWTLPSIGFFWSLVGMLIPVLHRILLQTPRHFPRIDRFLVFIAASFALFAVGFFFLPHRPLMHALSVWGLLTICLLSPILGYLAWRKGVVLWGYAFASYVLPWQVTLLLYFSSIGWLPSLPGAFTEHAMAGATVVASVIILSGLAARILQAQKEKADSKRKQRQTLEAQVRDRTRELERAREVAEGALEDNRQFLAMISHELRSPVASASSACTLLETRAEQDPNLPGPIIERIRRATERITAFLDNLLVEDQMESESWKVTRQDVSLGPLLEDVLDQARQSGPGHGFELNTERLPDTARIDPVLIRIMLRNLLENAIKYSPPGCRIVIGGDVDPSGHLILEVADEGSGLDYSQASHLFGKYVRGQNIGTVSGTGMGLYIVQRIAQLHGGDISVRSNPGVNTIFRVTIA
ncbi:MAG: hypothetical protein EA349_00525 [Halomonadaceae bacterium]|nr:MAG: hypothetical protein EA349_00525 [Halomonadaceae bacterium]